MLSRDSQYPGPRSGRRAPPSVEEATKAAIELTSYGLTMNQARIYLYLLAHGASPARTISRSLNLHRVDVYRKVHELEEMGVLELYLDSPKRYGAIDPKDAFSVLLHRQEQKLEASKQSSKALVARLDALKNSYGGPSDSQKEMLDITSTYKLILGRKRYYEEVADLIRKADKEVLRIVSAGGLIRTFPSGLYQEYVAARSRGVSLRMISEINSQNVSKAKRLAKVVELRHLDDVHLRFTVVDRSVAVLGARFNEDSMSLESPGDSHLIFEDPKFAEAFCFLFEHVWNTARKRANLK